MTLPPRWRKWVIAAAIVVELIGVAGVLWHAKAIMRAQYQFFDRYLGGCQLTGC